MLWVSLDTVCMLQYCNIFCAHHVDTQGKNGETCGARVSRTARWLVASGTGGGTRGCGRFTKPASTHLELSFTTDLSSWRDLSAVFHSSTSLFASFFFFFFFQNHYVRKSLIRARSGAGARTTSCRFTLFLVLISKHKLPELCLLPARLHSSPPWIWFGSWASLWASAPGLRRRSGTVSPGTARTQSKYLIIKCVFRCIRTLLRRQCKTRNLFRILNMNEPST